MPRAVCGMQAERTHGHALWSSRDVRCPPQQGTPRLWNTARSSVKRDVSDTEPASGKRRKRSACLRAGVLLSALLLGRTATGAEPPGAPRRLLYSRGAGASSCPDEQALRESVTARLGYDPFRADAEGAVQATLTGGPRGLRALVELRDRTGRVTGSRQLGTARQDCRELAAAMALAICIAVDPLILSRPVPSPSAPPPSAPPPIPCPACAACPPPPPQPPPPPPPPAEPVRFRAGAGLQLGLGAVPTLASLGVVAQAELRYRAFALALEGRADPSLGASRASPDTAKGGAGVSATLLLGLLVPCARWRFLGLCALIGVGALQGRGVGVAVPSRATTLYAAAGARLALEVPLLRRLALELHLDGLTPLTRTSLMLDGAEVWATPPLSGALGATLQVPFS